MMRGRDNDAGVTLVELLIAMAILGIAGAVIMSSMSALVYATTNQRAISKIDTVLRAYEEDIREHAEFRTSLVAAISASASSLTTASVAEFPPVPFEIAVDGEVVQVTSISGTSLSGLARGKRGTAARTHAPGAPVAVVYPPCQSVGSQQFVPASGAGPELASRGVTAIAYWRPSTLTWGTPSDCQSAVRELCPSFSLGNDAWRPECDPGLLKLTVSVTGNSVNKGVVQTTQVVVRRADL